MTIKSYVDDFARQLKPNSNAPAVGSVIASVAVSVLTVPLLGVAFIKLPKKAKSPRETLWLALFGKYKEHSRERMRLELIFDSMSEKDKQGTLLFALQDPSSYARYTESALSNWPSRATS